MRIYVIRFFKSLYSELLINQLTPSSFYLKILCCYKQLSKMLKTKNNRISVLRKTRKSFLFQSVGVGWIKTNSHKKVGDIPSPPLSPTNCSNNQRGWNGRLITFCLPFHFLNVILCIKLCPKSYDTDCLDIPKMLRNKCVYCIQ